MYNYCINVRVMKQKNKWNPHRKARTSVSYRTIYTFQTAEPELQKLLCADLENRLYQLKQRLTTLRTESDEVWKTLETAETTLLEMLTAKDYDCSTYFGDNAVPASKPPETVSLKRRADRHETEEFYLAVGYSARFSIAEYLPSPPLPSPSMAAIKTTVFPSNSVHSLTGFFLIFLSLGM